MICDFCGKEIIEEPIEIKTSYRTKIKMCRNCYAERAKMGRYTAEEASAALRHIIEKIKKGDKKMKENKNNYITREFYYQLSDFDEKKDLVEKMKKEGYQVLSDELNDEEFKEIKIEPGNYKIFERKYKIVFYKLIEE